MKITSLGRYEIRDELGRGTMGVVYRAWDPTIDRLLAVKTISVSDSMLEADRKAYLERFALEARIAGKLNHPNIVITYDAVTDPETGIPFIAMELVDGKSLSALLMEKGRLPWQEALEIVIPLANALDHAHQKGIVHRDIKPMNILIASDGTPKITDFGIAKLETGNLTRKGVILGTPHFMSPEQLRGGVVDGRSDLFCLAAVLYTILVDQPPFRGATVPEIFHEVVSKAPEPLCDTAPDIPVAIDAFLACAMAKSPDERYPTGAAFVEDLLAIKQGRPLSSALTLVVEKPSPGRLPSASNEEVGAHEMIVVPAKPRRNYRPLVLLAIMLAFLFYFAAAGEERPREKLQQMIETIGICTQGVHHRVDDLRQDFRRRREERMNRAALRSQAHTALVDGKALKVRGQWAPAQSKLDKSLSLFKQTEDGKGEASALLARGRLHNHRGIWLKALADLQAAASIFRVYEEPAGEARALASIANLDRDQGRFDKANELYNQASAVAGQLEDRSSWSEVRIEKALNDLLQGHCLASLESIEAIRGVTPSAAHDRLSVKTLLLQGMAFFVQEQSFRAFSCWEDARHICETLSNRELLAEVDLMEGRAALEAELLAESRTLLEAAEQSFREADHLPGLAAALENLAELATRVDKAIENRSLSDEVADIRRQLELPEIQGIEEGDDVVDPSSRRLLSLLRAMPCTAATEGRFAAVAKIESATKLPASAPAK